MALAAGFSEAISFAFIEARHAEPFLDGAAVALANPLSEKFAVMRPSLVPGLTAAVAVWFFAQLASQPFAYLLGGLNHPTGMAVYGTMSQVLTIAGACWFGPQYGAMGIAGAALATGIGQLLSLCVYLFVYVRTELPVRLRRSCLRPDAALDGKLYAIGVPAILNLALPSLLVAWWSKNYFLTIAFGIGLVILARWTGWY